MFEKKRKVKREIKVQIEKGKKWLKKKVIHAFNRDFFQAFSDHLIKRV